MEQIKQTVMVKVLSGDDIYMPVKLSEHASGANVRACIDMRVVLHPGGFEKIPLGIKMEPPEGYELQLRPRSGLASKGIMGSFGTIDADFRGELHAILFNFSSDNFIIKNRDRIGQLVLAKVEPVEYIQVNFLTDTKRGAGGFGSTVEPDEDWNRTKTVPDDNRFVILILRGGVEVEAQWIEKESLWRTGKQWIDRNGKYSATNQNPAIYWKEI